MYRFYGWETADVRDALGLTPRDYYDLLCESWCLETCTPWMRRKWSDQNRTLGQCTITAFLMQDVYGGEVLGIPVREGVTHCFNIVQGRTFDLTSEQFGDRRLDYSGATVQRREICFSDEGRYERYRLLRERLLRARAARCGAEAGESRIAGGAACAPQGCDG